MAGAGFKGWSTGDLVNASDFNTYIQEQTVMVFASSSARSSAVSSPTEGMISFLKDDDTLYYADASGSWVAYVGSGDISAVTITTSATSGLSGGASASSGAFSSTLLVAPNLATSATPASDDVVLIADTSDSNNLKKATVSDLVGTGGFADIGLVIALG